MDRSWEREKKVKKIKDKNCLIILLFEYPIEKRKNQSVKYKSQIQLENGDKM